MEDIKKSSNKSRLVVNLSKECANQLKKQAKDNFRDLSGELEFILTTKFVKDNNQDTHNCTTLQETTENGD